MRIDFDQSQDFDVSIMQESESVEFQNEQTINVSFDDVQRMVVGFQADTFTVDFGTKTPSGDYSGPYEVTPSTQKQTLLTVNKTLSQNVTVNPIPSNYGLITWNGSYLTVS